MNDQRTPLPKGSFREFEIVDVIGYGGSSLCYLVKRGHAFFIMKELYPNELSTNLIRSGFLLTNNPTNSSNVEKLMDQFKDDFLHEAEISKDLAQFRRTEDLMGDNPYFFNLEIQFAVEDSLSYYLVYQSKQGKTLFEYFKPSADNHLQRALSVLSLMKQLAEAVIEIHEYGYLHLDLKLDNIYVIAFRSPVVVLLDLGSALKLKHVNNVDADHLIRRISYAEQYSSSRLHRIYHLKRNMYQKLRLGHSAEVEVHTQEILGEIAKLNESEDVYSLYVMLFELLTGCTYRSEMLVKSVFDSQNLAFAPESVRIEIAKRISIGLHDENRTTAQFVNDIEEVREILLSNGVHPVLLRIKSKSHLEKRISELKYEIHQGIYAECEVIESNSRIVYRDLRELFSNRFLNDINKNVLVLGDGGSGKSTQLLDLSDWLLKTRINIVPFHISLIDFQMQHFKDLVGYVLHHYGGSFTENQRDRFYKLIEDDVNHQYIFLLDGFNEISLKDELNKEIQELAQCARVKLIITSRVEYSGFLNHLTVSIKQLSWDQVSNYSKDLGIRHLDKNELYKNPMLLTLTCRSNEYLKGDLISPKDLDKLEIQAGNNRMELIANYFTAQKIKHYRKFGCIWSDKNVVIRAFAYEVVLPQIARILFEQNTNSLSREDMVSALLEYFMLNSKVKYGSLLMNKIFQYGSIIEINEEFINNSLLIGLLCDELSILKVSESVTFVSEVFQDFFLAYQISNEIKFGSKLVVPLFKTYCLGYDHLKNVGDLLHEHRFADPTVSSLNKSYVELFLNKYRRIFDGSTKLLVKNSVELMRIARNGLILADLSHLDLTQARLTGSLYSTVGEIDSQPASFRGSHLSNMAFKTLEHRSRVDRIIVSNDTKLAASFSKKEGITKIWNIEESEYVSEFEGDFTYSAFINDAFILSYTGIDLVIHDAVKGEKVSTYPIRNYILTIFGQSVESIRLMGLIDNHIYFGYKSGDSNDTTLHILDMTIDELMFSDPIEVAEVDLEVDEVYGYDLEENINSIFEVEGFIFIIKICHQQKQETGFSTIEVYNISSNNKHCKMQVNLRNRFRIYQNNTKLFFEVRNKSASEYQIISWNLKNKQIKILGKHKNPFNILGVCEETRNIYGNQGSYIAVYGFITNQNSKTVLVKTMPALGYNYDDFYSYKFLIKNNRIIFLAKNDSLIMKIDAKTSTILSRCIVSREDDFKDVYCDGTFTGVVFSGKIYLFEKNLKRCFKSFYEVSTWMFSFGHEDFTMRKAILAKYKHFETQKKMLFSNLTLARSKPNYFYVLDFVPLPIDPFRFDSIVNGRKYSLNIHNRLKYIRKQDLNNSEKTELNMNDYSNLYESVYTITNSHLLYLTNSEILMINLENLELRCHVHNLFAKDLMISKKYPQYLKDVRLFDCINFEENEYFVILEKFSLYLIRVENESNIDIVLKLDLIQQACFTNDSLVVVDMQFKLVEYKLKNISGFSSGKILYDEDDTSTYSNVLSKQKSCNTTIAMCCDKEFVYILKEDMYLVVWDLRTWYFIGAFELQDTNIIGCDFSEAIFHQSNEIKET